MTFEFGNTPWNKGLTKETDSRLASLSSRLKGRTKETSISLASTSLKLQGRSKETHPYLVEAAEKRSKTLMGHIVLEKTRKKISNSHLGIKLSDEHVRSIREAAGKREPNRYWLGKTRFDMLGDNNPIRRIQSSPESYQKFLAACRKPEVSEAKRQAMNRLFKDEKFLAKLQKTRHSKPNRPEQKLIKLLNKHFPNTWKYVGDFQVCIGGKFPDFINCNGRKQLIELFGMYWHPDVFAEAERINIYRQYGFDCLIVWEHELRNKNDVLGKIMAFSKKRSRK